MDSAAADHLNRSVNRVTAVFILHTVLSPKDVARAGKGYPYLMHVRRTLNFTNAEKVQWE